MAKTHKHQWQQFLEICSDLKTTGNFEQFFDVFLTFTEREELAARLQIVKELLKGEKTQREIALEFGVSIAKITRGSNQLKTTDAKFKQLLLKKLTCN